MSEKIEIFALQNEYLSAVHIDLDPRILKKLPWAIPLSTKIRDVLQAIQDSPLNSVLVVDEDGQVAGALTQHEAIAIKCKGPKKRCWSKCEEACTGRGGCWFTIVGLNQCYYECKDRMPADVGEKTLGDVFNGGGRGR